MLSSPVFHVRAGIYEDKIIIYEAQSDHDQAAQDDLFQLFYQDGPVENYYRNNYNEYLLEDLTYNEYDTDNYKKGDIVFYAETGFKKWDTGGSLFVAQEDNPGVLRVSDSDLVPISKGWRMLGKRKSGLSVGYESAPGKDLLKKI